MLWELPGPRSFLRQIETDLGRSGVCVVACPRPGAPEGLTEALEHASIEQKLDPLVVDAPSLRGSALRTWLAAELAAPFPPGTEPTVQALLRDQRVGDRRIVIDARQNESAAFADLCAEWVEATSRQEGRLGLVVLTAGAMPSLHSAVGQRWWWGQMRRLDSEVAALRFTDSQGDDPLFVSTVAELAGSNLDLAERLAANWNGEIQFLHRLLPADNPHGADSGDLGPASHAPAGPHLQTWINGEVEVWDGRVRACLDSCSNVRGESEIRLRSAQIRSLFPGIENDRQRLIRKCRSWSSSLELKQNEDFESIEIGRLAYLLESASGLPSSANHAKRAARALANIRNDLAHRRLADRRTLKERNRLFDLLDE